MDTSTLNERDVVIQRLAYTAVEAWARSEALESAILKLERTHGVSARSILLEASFEAQRLSNQKLDRISQSDLGTAEWLRKGSENRHARPPME